MPEPTIQDVLDEVQPALEKALPMLRDGYIEDEEFLTYPHPDAPEIYEISITFDNDGVNEGWNLVSVALTNEGGLICFVSQAIVSGNTAIEQIVFTLRNIIPPLNDHFTMLNDSEQLREYVTN